MYTNVIKFGIYSIKLYGKRKYYPISLSDNTILMMLINVWTMRQTEIHIYEKI